MEKLKRILRINYWLIIICFFLPFMVDTCIHDQLHPGERKFKDSLKEATLAKEKAEIDFKDSIKIKGITISPKTDSIKKETLNFKENISFVRKLYNFIISPSDMVITGVGYIIYRSSWKTFSPALGLLLSLISLILVYLKNSRYKLLFFFSIINMLGLIELFILNLADFSAFLYGFWIMLILYISALILIRKLIKKQKESEMIVNE